MALWSAIYFPTPGNLATAEWLGNLRARHQPAAMLRAFEKWPDKDQSKIAVRRAGNTITEAVRVASRAPTPVAPGNG